MKIGLELPSDEYPFSIEFSNLSVTCSLIIGFEKREIVLQKEVSDAMINEIRTWIDTIDKLGKQADARLIETAYEQLRR